MHSWAQTSWIDLRRREILNKRAPKKNFAQRKFRKLHFRVFHRAKIWFKNFARLQIVGLFICTSRGCQALHLYCLLTKISSRCNFMVSSLLKHKPAKWPPLCKERMMMPGFMEVGSFDSDCIDCIFMMIKSLMCRATFCQFSTRTMHALHVKNPNQCAALGHMLSKKITLNLNRSQTLEWS